MRTKVLRRRLSLLALVGSLVIGVVAVASASSSPDNHRDNAHRRTPARPPHRSAHVAAATESAFPVLASTPSASDALPPRVAGGLVPLVKERSLSTPDSRLLGSTGTTRAWVVPGPADICVVVSQGSGAQAMCGRISGVAAHGMFGTLEGTFVGLFASNVAAITVSTASGPSSFTPNGNGAIVAPIPGPIGGVDLRDSAGNVIPTPGG